MVPKNDFLIVGCRCTQLLIFLMLLFLQSVQESV